MGSLKSVRRILSTRPDKPFERSVSDAIIKPKEEGRDNVGSQSGLKEIHLKWMKGSLDRLLLKWCANLLYQKSLCRVLFYHTYLYQPGPTRSLMKSDACYKNTLSPIKSYIAC